MTDDANRGKGHWTTTCTWYEMSMDRKPFAQLPFSEVPDVPRVPHGFDDTTVRTIHVPFGSGMDVSVRTMGSGPPLLLLHGLMTSNYSWRYVFRTLAERFTVYAPDLPSNGTSDIVTDESYAPARLAQWLGDVMTGLDIVGCAVVGNSMGGYLAMQAALDGVPMARLVQLHGPGVPLPRLRALKLALALPGTASLFDWLVRRDVERWVHTNVHYYDETLKSREEHAHYADPLRTREGRRGLYKYLHETMNVDDLARFGERLAHRCDRGEGFPVPLQLIYARQDPMVPPVVGRKLAALVPSAEMVWLDEASHFAHVDNPQAFLDAALPFLAAATDGQAPRAAAPSAA